MSESTVGSRIVAVRGALSQEAFAKDLREQKSTLGAYERGERKPNASFLAKLAARGVNINWLLTGQGDEHTGAAAVADEAPSYLGQNNYDIDLNLDVLRACIEGVESGLHEAGAIIPASKKAEVICRFYRMFASQSGVDFAALAESVAGLTRAMVH